MTDTQALQQVEVDYQADLAAVDRHYAAVCQAAGQRRRNAIAEAARVRAERLEATRRNMGVFA